MNRRQTTESQRKKNGRSMPAAIYPLTRATSVSRVYFVVSNDFSPVCVIPVYLSFGHT
jgi:hypothetical protein